MAMPFPCIFLCGNGVPIDVFVLVGTLFVLELIPEVVNCTKFGKLILRKIIKFCCYHM